MASRKASTKESPTTFDLSKPETWGPAKYEIALHIDRIDLLRVAKEYVIDVEDNEAGVFVGLGLYAGGSECFYFTRLDDDLCRLLSTYSLVAHNGKSDLHKLQNWGINVRASQLVFDTMICSYVMDSTKESHGLKELVQSELSISYPSYRDIVGSGRTKRTLDLQSVELVANYNAMDCIATYKLWKHYEARLTADQRKYFEELEMPTTRLLFDMECRGIKVNVGYLQDLDAKILREQASLEARIKRFAPEIQNVNSNDQVANYLVSKGFTLPKTPKGALSVNKAALQPYRDVPFVQLLNRYSEVEKLSSTYTAELASRGAADVLNRIHSTFNQVAVQQDGSFKGIRTGRLSSSEPNLHNIPTRTKTGELLRKAFIANGGRQLICADYSQIEYRLLAHFSQEERLIQAFKEGRDVHEETGRVLGVDRKLGKTLNFAAIYGAQADRIALTAKISPQQAQAFLDAYWKKLPGVQRFVKETHAKAAAEGGIRTLFGRWIPLAGFKSANFYKRLEAERQSVNYVIQGSAAEIIKRAMLKLDDMGLQSILQVHDELLFEFSAGFITPLVLDQIKSVMENVVALSVPLLVEPGVGHTWQDAK